MEELTVTLFERIGLLLIVAFMMTRIPSFRYLLDRELNYKTIIYYSLIFGLYGMICVHVGVVITDHVMTTPLWTYQLNDNQMLVGSTLVAVVIAGLLGGPFVGLGSGMIVATYLVLLGGDFLVANSLVNPLAGLFAGFTARFFSEERVIAPAKALFIGMFTPILHMTLLLIFTEDPNKSIQIVNTIGIPLVITDSIAIAIFTAMIRVALNEKEQEAALETRRALKIAEEALPHLKQGFHFQSAMEIARLLRNELKIAAVSLTNKEMVLAHIGLGSDHHKQGEPLQTVLSFEALKTGEIKIARNPGQIHCNDPGCPLHAAIIVPIKQSGEVTGLIKLYFKRSQQIRAVEIALAQGLGKLISNQLDVVAAEKMKSLIQEAELRNLQAQINPHFLFNTLHSVATSIRSNPSLARHLVIQLGHFMRMNLKLTRTSLIQLEKELEHLRAYLEIVKVRFADQLTIDYDVEEGVREAMIPPFTLQPLVENCIQHGLKDVEHGGEIRIHINQKGNQIRIEIQDNGKGIPEHIIHKLGSQPLQSQAGNGIGIYNVNQRLINLLGESSGLHFKNLKPAGCCISFQIPEKQEQRRDVG
ncbi:MAG: histidine kinase [Bacillaceae bacterium]|nr:histidine kinase [Bacillaceae bacterium]